MEERLKEIEEFINPLNMKFPHEKVMEHLTHPDLFEL